MGFLARSTLLGLVLVGLAAGGERAAGSSSQALAGRVQVTPAATEKPAIEPTSTPSEGPGSPEIERLPGRDDPNEFYKKPPRKPRIRSHMYA